MGNQSFAALFLSLSFRDYVGLVMFEFQPVDDDVNAWISLLYLPLYDLFIILESLQFVSQMFQHFLHFLTFDNTRSIILLVSRGIYGTSEIMSCG
jgi:hypothetical protein